MWSLSGRNNLYTISFDFVKYRVQVYPITPRHGHTVITFAAVLSIIIIWLANFAGFDWSIPRPITYGTDPDGPACTVLNNLRGRVI